MQDPFREATRDYLECLREHHGDRLVSVYLAGSVVRGEAVPGLSDVNLICLLRETPPDAETEESWYWETTRALEDRHPALARPDPDAVFTFAPYTYAALFPPEPPAEPRDEVLELQWGGELLWGEEIRERMPSCPPPRVPSARAWLTRATRTLVTAEEGREHPRLAGHRAAKAALTCCLAASVAEGEGFTLESPVIAERFASRHPEWDAWVREFARARLDPPIDPERLASLCEAARVLVDWTATILYAIGRPHNMRV
jgi:hypothetical protein